MLTLIHPNRNLQKLRRSITDKDYERLQSITDLDTSEKVADWKEFCKNHPVKEVKGMYPVFSSLFLDLSNIDWFKNKMANVWMLSGINPHESKLSPEHWGQVRHNTNLCESAHAATNAKTGIRLPLLQAINTSVYSCC
jgi:hypothetical protein